MSFLFLIAVWVGGKAAAGMRMPPLVGGLLVGFVMGPPLLDAVPLAEALMLYGEVGLLLLVRRCRSLHRAPLPVDARHRNPEGGCGEL